MKVFVDVLFIPQHRMEERIDQITLWAKQKKHLCWYLGTKLWDKLALDTQFLEDIHMFKIKIKENYKSSVKDLIV